MKSVDKEKLRKIIMKNVRLFQLTIKDKKDGYFMKEDFHLFTLIGNAIPERYRNRTETDSTLENSAMMLGHI